MPAEHDIGSTSWAAGAAATLPELPTPQDVDHPGVLELAVNASDVERGIVEVRMRIPAPQGQRLTLLYPKWMPGYHSPQNPIELLAGLEVQAVGQRLDWRRDAVEVYAFHIDLPACEAVEATFQFLSPTSSTQGEVVVTRDMLLLHWGRVVLYPAGFYARRILVQPRLKLPHGWGFATALGEPEREGDQLVFAPVPLDVLVDSPVMAGPHHSSHRLDAGPVELHLFAHELNALAATPEQIEPHREMVSQADRLFGARPFDRYRFLVGLTEELGGGGVEHHRSAEILTDPGHFTDWERTYPQRDVFAHEYIHAWNGKSRRGADSWTPSFEQPIRNSLMWVYEGQTQYWGHVLTARAGLWSRDTALEALAKVAGVYDVRPGEAWRSVADTTRDPIIAGREPLPWPSWQRSEDYYSEGQLMWLGVDTLIRELSGEARSLDDFARLFFGSRGPPMTTSTYAFDDVVGALNHIVAYDWRGRLCGELNRRERGAPLDGVTRGGYRLVWRSERTRFCRDYDALLGQFDVRFSVGLTLGRNGMIQEVMWGSPAFAAGLTAGAQITHVNGCGYSDELIASAIDDAGDRAIELETIVRSRSRRTVIRYSGGHRFPHLERVEGAVPRLDHILRPL